MLNDVSRFHSISTTVKRLRVASFCQRSLTGSETSVYVHSAALRWNLLKYKYRKHLTTVFARWEKVVTRRPWEIVF
jgi:hypothetical protein